MKKICFLFAFSLMTGFMSAQAPISYSVENDITHAYLNDFSYDTIPDYNISYVRDYAKMPHDYRLDAPKPVRLSWNHEDGAETQRVEVSESSTYSDSIVFTINKDSAQYDLYNLIPGRHYYYRIISVKNENETKVGSGELEPTGMLRMLYAEGTLNVRDMGGWTGLGGNPIKYGQLFRGARWSENSTDAVLITEDGKTALRNAGIKAELDLRQDSESKLTKSPLSVNGDVDYKRVSNSVNARMNKLDAADANIVEVQWVIDELKKGKPVYFHCSMGADRTGTLGFILGALFGMSVNDLTKDYELTTFCAPYTGENGFARIRYSRTKLGSPSSEWEPYTLYPLIQKMATMPGGTYQRKIYNFLKTGVNGKKIKSSDLIWLIHYMVGYVVVDDIETDCETLITMDKGQQIVLNAKVLPDNASNKALSYSSNNTKVAIVSDDGIITAVGGGEATISVKADDYVKVIKVSIEKVESTVPASVEIAGESYSPKAGASNKVKDGSFEYGYYYEWKSAKDTAMTSRYFDLTKYSQNADSVYLESKIDGDETSEGSIRMEWTTPKKRTFVFGFRVKNSTNVTTTHNENLKIMLTNDDKPDDDPSAYIFEYPSYSGEWTEVQYAFTTTTQNRLRILFTHLSKDGNNTCFDNFYLIELDVPSGVTVVNPIKAQPAYAKAYDMSGRVVDENARGIIIKNGKKVLK